MKCLCLYFLVLEPLDPDDVTNDKTGETYNSVILNPMIDDLVRYVAGYRDGDYAYIPDDVGLVQSIMSAQMTMFQLASFYIKFYSKSSIVHYEGGLGKSSYHYWNLFILFFIYFIEYFILCAF